MVSPYSAGTFTLQEAPSFAWRTNGPAISRKRRELNVSIRSNQGAPIDGCIAVLGATLLRGRPSRDKERFQRCFLKQLALQDNCPDSLGVSDLLKRIRVEEHKVSNLSHGNRSGGLRYAEVFCRISRGGLKRFHRRQAGLYEESQFVVHAESRENVRIDSVRARHELDSRVMHHAHDLEQLSKDRLVIFEVLGVVLSGQTVVSAQVASK